MKNPKAVGEMSEAMVLAALLRAGQTVLLPFGDNQRYDLVVDASGAFKRIQCKTGRVRNGVIEVSTCSVHDHRKKPRRGYRGDADYFGVYVPVMDETYMVSVSSVPERTVSLRLRPPKNKQVTGIRFADDHKLSAVVAQW